MKRILFATTALLALATMPAKADLVIDPTGNGFFADLGGTGFGVAPRLLTLQNNTLEAGGTIATAGGGTAFFGGGVPTVPQFSCSTNGGCGVAGGGTRVGTNESLVYSLAALGWTSGAEVGIGLDTNEALGGSPSLHALTFQTLQLTLYNINGVALGSFSGNGPVDISQALLDFQQGNGNSVFNIGLDAAQQAQFDSILAANGGPSNIFEGLRASFGCGALAPAVCNTPLNFSSTDGAESFLAFQQSAVVPGPIVGAGLPGLAGVLLLWIARFRQKRRGYGPVAA